MIAGNIGDFLNADTLRGSGEVHEVTQIAGQIGFAVPVFVSNTLRAELTPQPAIAKNGVTEYQITKGMLELLFEMSKKAKTQTVRFPYVVPSWDITKQETDYRDLDLQATLFAIDESAMVIITEYGEVADILEGRPRSD